MKYGALERVAVLPDLTVVPACAGTTKLVKDVLRKRHELIAYSALIFAARITLP
jgi:hypothetical protein